MTLFGRISLGLLCAGLAGYAVLAVIDDVGLVYEALACIAIAVLGGVMSVGWAIAQSRRVGSAKSER